MQMRRRRKNREGWNHHIYREGLNNQRKRKRMSLGDSRRAAFVKYTVPCHLDTVPVPSAEELSRIHCIDVRIAHLQVV